MDGRSDYFRMESCKLPQVETASELIVKMWGRHAERHPGVSAGGEPVHLFPDMGSPGVTYQGQQLDNQVWDGEGKLSWSGGQYQGQFRRGRAHGHGEYVNRSGGKYMGSWQDGQAHGYGEEIFQGDFRSYKGEWRGDRPHGRGVEVYTNGDRYTGGFSQGLRHGAGHFRFELEDIAASASPGAREARGKLSERAFPQGAQDFVERYEGEFAYGHLEGTGQYFWKDGSVFSGQWVRSMMQGQGVFNWPGGKTWYQGEFHANHWHGEGTYRFADGQEYLGRWSDGKPTGGGSVRTYLAGNDSAGDRLTNAQHPHQWTNSNFSTNAGDEAEDMSQSAAKGHASVCM